MSNDIHPSLRPTAEDRAATALRALGSTVDLVVPGLGSVFGEIIGVVIPNLKSERLEAFLTRLARRLSLVEADLQSLTARLGPEQIDLFEQGARAATSATSNDRIDQIATVVANGMTGTDRDAVSRKSLLLLMSQLTDDDFIRLASFHHIYSGNKDWIDLHQRVLDPTAGLFGPEQNGTPTWTPAAYAAAAEESIQVNRLLSLGLVQQATQIKTTDSRHLAMGRDSEPKLVKGPIHLSAAGNHLLRHVGLI